MNVKGSRYLGLQHFYEEYTYPVHRNSDPKIPKKNSTNHEHSLTYKEWRKICTVYLELLYEQISQGKEVCLPYKLGLL